MVDSTAPRDLNPKCEDYHSDDSDDGVVLDDAYRTSPMPAANVAAKRSPSAELGNLGKLDVLPSDMQSDSGARSPPTAPTSAAPNPPSSPATGPTRRRPTLVADDRQSSHSSPRKPLQRAPSNASKRPPTNRRPSTSVTTETVDCTDPNCRECTPNALAYRNRRLDSALDVSYPQAYDVRSQHSEPTPSTTYSFPSSPTYSRQPAPYAQGPAIVQPAQTRRRSSSTTGPRRPATYYNEDPGQAYYGQGALSGGYPGTPQEHGPPPSLARYTNMPHPQMQHPQTQHPHMSPYMMPSAAPYYPNGQPMAQHQRPPLSARNSSNQNYQTRRPVSGYGPAQIIQQDQSEQMPSARYSSVPKGTRHEELQDEEDSESSDSEYSSGEEEQPRLVKPRELMPPPKLKTSSKDRRPAPQKPITTTVVNDGRNGRRGSVSQPQPPRRRDSTVRTSRPPLVQNPKAVSFPRQSNKASVVVENPKQQRRRSYQQPYETDYDREPPLGRSYNHYEDQEMERKRSSRTPKLYHDDQYEREVDHKRANRNSKIYPDIQQFELEPKRHNREPKVYRNEPEPERRRHRDSGVFNDYDEDSIEQRRPRRGTDAHATKRDNYTERKDRHKASEAEAYQQRTRGSNDPLNDLVHKAALKKQSRVPSDGASSRSDDKKSRVSRAQTTMTSGGNGEIRLRVDASAPISVSLNGDMNGRTLQVVPGEDGMADIVIGGQDNETVYQSERGSVLAGHRKSITAAPHPRRDAEEQSIRSSRSGNTRREAERREAERPTRGGGALRRRPDFN
ncbi:hypothetical protein DM02DRAFT_173908 [Periconia macrospinosa]|uniref:Uncharacterized protein n=1 Tax=Periconia macrospinosa TaxID=97972 RepID=A0A2V1D9W2_9PLEO|nr:hypothetical protein DM02DRAFT_173908 [Periconia macrospinosa]